MKIGAGDAAEDVRREAQVLAEWQASFLPGFVAFVDDDEPTLVREDLSEARFGIPVAEQGQELAGLMHTIGQIASLPVPAWLPQSTPEPPDPWRLVGVGPQAERFGLRPDSVELLRSASLTRWRHDAVVHGDLAPSNWCLAPRGWVFTDWAGTRVSDSRVDPVVAAVRLRAAGIKTDLDIPELAGVVALIAGFVVQELASDRLPEEARPSKEADANAACSWALDLLG
ncbi:MAG: hypothetical protein ACYDD4_11590 [Acidimicrobiales bacterium]